MQRKGLSILEVLLVFGFWRVGLSLLFAYFSFNTYGWGQFVVPVGILLLTRRRFADYGFTVRNWQTSTDIGLTGYLLTCIPVGGLLIMLWIGGHYYNVLEGLLNGAFSLLAVCLLLLILHRRDTRELKQGVARSSPTFPALDSGTVSATSPTSPIPLSSPSLSSPPLSSPPSPPSPIDSPDESPTPNYSLPSPSPPRAIVSPVRDSARLNRLGRNNVIIICVLLIFPTLLAVILRLPAARVGTVASWSAWQFVVSGFGEETFFRGYIQSRVNADFGRPWTIKGVQFGPGLFVAAACFGISHILNPFNPWAGSYTLAWGWGISSFVMGLFFGLIREKTGDLIGPGIAHGLPDAVGESLYLIFTGSYI